MDKLTISARLLLGLIFTVFGINGFFPFIDPPAPPEAGMQFLSALGATGYFFPVLKITEIAVGISLLTDRFTALALVILAPISIQIFLYHLNLDPSGLALPILILILHIFLASRWKEKYSKLLKP